MSKTLVDMTAEEREECVGMWADVVGFTRPTPIVEMWGEEVELLVHDNLRGHITATYEFKHVTPRFDLPRVWTPDGEPDFARALAEEEYQYGVTYTGVKHGGHHIEWVEATGNAELDRESLQLLVKHWKNAGQSPKVLRRRVSPPEVINE